MLCLTGSVVMAAPPEPEGPKAAIPPALFDPLSSTYLFKLVLSLLLVLALMFLAVWLLKRTGRFDGRGGRYPLRVLTQMSVGTRERVLLVAVGDRQMLLGVTTSHIESLGWVDPPIDIEPASLSTSLMGHDSPFGRLLQSQIKRKSPPADPSASPPHPDDGSERRL